MYKRGNMNGVILINSFTHPDEIPSFFGWKPFIVLSGSMESEIYAGDLAVVKESDSVKQGDIITYTLRIYNEGEISGYASEISDDIRRLYDVDMSLIVELFECVVYGNINSGK